MNEGLAKGMEFLRTHQTWAGPLLGLLASFESLVLIGAFAPLTASLIMVGAAIAARVFQPEVMVWIMAGCAVGNGLSYEVGALVRRRGRAASWIPARARALADTLFRRYGALAVLIARFLGPPASVTPFLAGWAALSRSHFWLANLVTCILWPTVMASLGYFGARSLGFALAAR
jgi:membrane protein DedA with SNARE-associated domain